MVVDHKPFSLTYGTVHLIQIIIHPNYIICACRPLISTYRLLNTQMTNHDFLSCITTDDCSLGGLIIAWQHHAYKQRLHFIYTVKPSIGKLKCARCGHFTKLFNGGRFALHQKIPFLQSLSCRHGINCNAVCYYSELECSTFTFTGTEWTRLLLGARAASISTRMAQKVQKKQADSRGRNTKGAVELRQKLSR